MSETIATIGAEVRDFLNSANYDVYRAMSRTAVFHSFGQDIPVVQHKLLSPDNADQIRSDGIESFTTPEWFNGVALLSHPDEEESSWHRLRLEATYPMAYFDEKPRDGSFRNDDWLDQYGSISGFGSKKTIDVWHLDFVAPNSRAVTRLHYPNDPTALDRYNARYQQYLHDLTDADPTICYYRGWDRMFSKQAEDPSFMLGGMALAGISLNEVITQGAHMTETEANDVRLIFQYESEQDGYSGRDIVITADNEATTEPYWDSEKDRAEADEDLLVTALELLRNTTASYRP